MIRIPADILAQLKVIPTAVLSDECNHQRVMDYGLRALSPGKSFAGHARTIRTIPQPNPAAYWLAESCVPGDVIVVDGHCYPQSAIWGGNMIAAAEARGVCAVIVDGNVRDGAELRAAGPLVYARRVLVAGWDWGGELDEPIVCGGVAISPGDLLVGDEDGVIAIPSTGLDDLIARCRKRMSRDENYRARLTEGKSALELRGLPRRPVKKGNLDA